MIYSIGLTTLMSVIVSVDFSSESIAKKNNDILTSKPTICIIGLALSCLPWSLHFNSQKVGGFVSYICFVDNHSDSLFHLILEHHWEDILELQAQ